MDIITSEELREIISDHPESEVLDFKQEWPKDNASLIHDILCLSNAMPSAPKVRMLIIGVTDDDNGREIHDVSEDEKRKDTAKLNDMFGKICNHIPDIKVQKVKINENEVHVIIIKDKPEKPYYLIKDYKKSEKGKKVRAGVIYSRTGDRNTPIEDEAINDLKLQVMFEERLGIKEAICERFLRYLKQDEGWESNNRSSFTNFYYKKHPEFTIIERDNATEITREERWMPKSIEAQRVCRLYELKYHTTVIRNLKIFDSGDGNYEMCWPKGDIKTPKSKINTDGKDISYYFKKNSIRYYFSLLLFNKHRDHSHIKDFRRLPEIEIRD